MRRVLLAAGVTVAVTALAAGCSSSGASTGSGSSSGGSSSAPVTLRLGFLANITHAPALVALKEGFFAKDLGKNVTLKTSVFSSGTQETTALLAGQLDAAYVGPNPAINAWQKSSGKAIKIVSGAASGGAALVVKKGITSVSQLKGQKLATPSLGNMQDVALRYYLKSHGLTSTETGGGDVPITPISPNSDAVLEFKSGQIAGGSEPAPYDVEMVQEGGTVLLNETGVTTIMVVTQSFLSAHPAVVADLLKAQIQANDYIKSDPATAQTDANAELGSFTGKPLKASVVAAAWKEITFTNDPDESSLTTDASQAVSLGLLKPVNLKGIFDLDPLNKALAAAGESQVSS